MRSYLSAVNSDYIKIAIHSTEQYESVFLFQASETCKALLAQPRLSAFIVL